MYFSLLVGGRLAQYVFENGLRFWIDSFFEDACDAWRVAFEYVDWAIKWTTFKLRETRYRSFEFILEFLCAIVNWIDS